MIAAMREALDDGEPVDMPIHLLASEEVIRAAMARSGRPRAEVEAAANRMVAEILRANDR